MCVLFYQKLSYDNIFYYQIFGWGAVQVSGLFQRQKKCRQDRVRSGRRKKCIVLYRGISA
jgi:hypothetical protein